MPSADDRTSVTPGTSGSRDSSAEKIARWATRLVILAFVLVGALLLGGCSSQQPVVGTTGTRSTGQRTTGASGGSSASTLPGRPAHVRIGYLPALCQSAVILRPLDLVPGKLHVATEWKQYTAGPAMVQAFAQGQLDVGFLGIPPTLIGINAGVPIQVVASTHAEGSDLVARAGGGFKDLAQLQGNVAAVLRQFVGKTIGAPPKGSIQDVVLRESLRRSGLEGRVNIKNIPAVPSMPDMLAGGQIDGMVVWPPFDTVARMRGAGKLVVPAHELWPDSPTAVLVVTKRLIEQYPEFVQALVSLHVQASRFIMAYPDQAATIASQFLGVPRPIVRQSLSDNPQYSGVPDEMYLRGMDQLITAAKKLGYIRATVTRSDLYAGQFVSSLHVNRERGVGTVAPDPALYRWITGKAP